MTRIGLARPLVSVVALVAAAAAGGCGSTGVGNPPDNPDAGYTDDAGLSSTEQALLDDGNDTVVSSDVGSSIVTIPLAVFGKADMVAVPADTAAFLSASVTTAPVWKDAFKPAGCVTASNGGTATATFTFAKGCSLLALGILSIEGTLTATFSPRAAGGLLVDIKSKDLKLSVLHDGVKPLGVVDVAGTATVAVEGATITRTWNGGYHGLTPRGRTLSHEAVYSFSYNVDTQCLEIPVGASTSSIEPPLRGLTTSVSDYKRCGPRNKCPESGVLVFTDRASDLTLSLRFLGGQSARVTPPVGRAFNVTIACTP